MRNRIVVAALVALVFCISRAPFVGQPMVGEEGMYADLYVHSPSGPAYELWGRINGMTLRGTFLHPALLYESMTRVGDWARLAGWKPDGGGSPDAVVRSLNSLFQLVFWVALALTVPWEIDDSKIALAACLVLLISPLAVGGSMYIQTDTTVGWLACGELSIALHAGVMPLWVLTAMAVGFFGKQEWNVCLIAAGFVSLIWGLLAGKVRWAGSLALMALGVIAGSLMSWAFDPVNWSEGLKLMLRISSANNIVSEPSRFTFWLQGVLLRAPYLGALFLALAAQTWLVLSRGWRQIELRSALSLSFSVALTAPFLLSTWAAEYRYFAPAFAAASVGVVFELCRWENASSSATKKFVTVLGLSGILGVVFMVICFAESRSVTEGPTALLQVVTAHDQSAVLSARRTGCIPRLSTGFAYARSNLDFIGSSLSLEDARAIAAKAGRTVCP